LYPNITTHSYLSLFIHFFPMKFFLNYYRIPDSVSSCDLKMNEDRIPDPWGNVRQTHKCIRFFSAQPLHSQHQQCGIWERANAPQPHSAAPSAGLGRERQGSRKLNFKHSYSTANVASCLLRPFNCYLLAGSLAWSRSPATQWQKDIIWGSMTFVFI
jgi:hypothetical protein